MRPSGKYYRAVGLSEAAIQARRRGHLPGRRAGDLHLLAGVTQHKHSIATVREITNLQLLFGQLGKPGAGLCPVRGHSNVQGNRTMGNFTRSRPRRCSTARNATLILHRQSRAVGHNTVKRSKRCCAWRSKVLIALGGNLAAAAPTPSCTARALRNRDATVHQHQT